LIQHLACCAQRNNRRQEVEKKAETKDWKEEKCQEVNSSPSCSEKVYHFALIANPPLAAPGSRSPQAIS
jgi:hypothetical protein